jgi:hypothetical protein
MSFWQILKPQAGKNLITQPSFELDLNSYGTSPWTAVNSTIGRTDDWQYRGTYALRVTPTANTSAGVQCDVGINGNGTDAYTFSVHGKFSLGVPYRIRLSYSSGTTVGTPYTFTGTGTTQRVSVTVPAAGIFDRVHVEKNNSASTAVFYLDAAQLEIGSVATTYIDGDQDGCRWQGIPEFSTSVRSGQSTAGGVWLDFETDLGIIPLEMQGVGMPPIDNVATPYALLPGARFERALARSRVFTILCLVPGSTWQNMHALREALIGRVQPDQTAQQQPIYLRYTGAAEPQIIAAFYDGGLEFSQPDGFAEQVPLRFVAHDPFWYSEQDQGIQLTQSSFIDVFTGGAMLNTTDGIWTNWTADLNGAVRAILEDSDGTFILGGDFDTAGGNAGADYITRYNPFTGAFTAIGAFNNTVRGLAYYNGLIVAVGDFTTEGGNTCRRIAAYDPLSPGWFELGNANAVVTSAIATAGYLVVAGNFTTIDGLTRTRIARYDGSWSSIGTGLNGQGNTLKAVSPQNDAFYVGGAFTTAAGTTVNRIAYYNGSTFTAMGTTGVNNTVNALALTSDGTLYVGGAFTTAGGVSAPYIALWTGTGWQALPSGPRGSVTALAVTPDQTLLVATNSGFTSLYDATNGGTIIAQFRGNTWLQLYHTIVSGSDITALHQSLEGYLVFGHETVAGLNLGQTFTVTNSGTAPTQIVVAPAGFGLYNFVTKQGVYLSVSTSGETIVDMRSTRQRIVTWISRQPANNTLLSGSSIGTFQLMPGDNVLAGVGSTGLDVAIYWRPRNWSLDV